MCNVIKRRHNVLRPKFMNEVKCIGGKNNDAHKFVEIKLNSLRKTKKDPSNHLWLRIVTAKSGHNAAGLRKFQKSGLNCLFLRIFVTFFCTFYDFFFTFWDGQLLYYKICHIVTAKSGHNEDGYRKLQKSFFIWLFCDYLWLSLYSYFTSVLNRLTYIACCRTNNYQKHLCFWWSNITSLINSDNGSF
jgi:hypothetical protein